MWQGDARRICIWCTGYHHHERVVIQHTPCTAGHLCSRALPFHLLWYSAFWNTQLHNVLLLQGGWDSDGVFTPGWDAFAGFFEATAKRLGACRSRQLGPGGVRVIGPGWDNVRRGAQQHQLTVHVNCTPAQYWWEHRSAVVNASP